MVVPSLGQDHLEKKVASHSSIIAWRIPGQRSLAGYNPTVQFSSVAQSCLTRCNPMGYSMPGLPVHHRLMSLPKHVHWVGDAIQPSHPLSSLSPPSFNLSQNQGLSQWVSSLHQVAKVLEFQSQYQSLSWLFRNDLGFRIDFRIDFLDLLVVQGTLKSLL